MIDKDMSCVCCDEKNNKRMIVWPLFPVLSEVQLFLNVLCKLHFNSSTIVVFLLYHPHLSPTKWELTFSRMRVLL